MISLAVRRWHCDRTIFLSQISNPRDRDFFGPDVGFRGYACDIWTGAPGIKNPVQQYLAAQPEDLHSSLQT